MNFANLPNEKKKAMIRDMELTITFSICQSETMEGCCKSIITTKESSSKVKFLSFREVA
jgi:hypothetical protein